MEIQPSGRSRHATKLLIAALAWLALAQGTEAQDPLPPLLDGERRVLRQGVDALSPEDDERLAATIGGLERGTRRYFVLLVPRATTTDTAELAVEAWGRLAADDHTIAWRPESSFLVV